MRLRGSISWRGPAAVVGAWVLTVLYLGGPGLLLAFVLMTGGLLLPVAALLADSLNGVGLSDELRLCAGAGGALLLAIPGYYLRRLVPVPGALFDVLVGAAAFGAALRTGALGRAVRAALSPVMRAAGWLVGGLVPALACLVWMGFEVRRGDALKYYGLFTIDFSNLSAFTAMIKDSAGPPAFMTAGGGALHYHWWYYTVAAWMSEFAGANGRSSSALALANFLAAILLAATVTAFVAVSLLRRAVPLTDRARHRLASASAAIAIVAPMSIYAYQALVYVLHRPWFTFGVRNSLLLSVVNSMSTFGNNTLALALVLIIVELLGGLGDKPSWKAAWAIAFSSFALFGLSITLTFPLALAIGLWILMGRVQKPWRLVAASAVVGAIGFPILKATSIMGDSSQHLVLSFDHGQFLQNVALGMAPVWALAGASLIEGRRRLSFPWLLVLAGLAIPTMVDFVGHGAVSSTMSMKTASLLAIAAAPMIAEGLIALLGIGAADRAAAPGWRRPWRAVAALALLLGVGNTLVYAGQFSFYRFSGRGRSASIPVDYANALDYVRHSTPRNAVVVDPNGDLLKDTIGTVLIGERQVWLPTIYTVDLFKSDADKPEIMARPALWRSWEQSGFRDEAAAATIAGQTDVLVAKPGIASASWQPAYAAGAVAVYRSRGRGSL